VILVDTSVWVQHLRRGEDRLARLLLDGQVASHAFVIGELALGSLNRRRKVLGFLAELPAARTVRHEDAFDLIERRDLSGRGIGWVDVHLLASALVERMSLWTHDRRLAAVASQLEIAWEETR
jgi:predicted nucleic acid-binding protein